MGATYRVVLNGTMPGQAIDRVAQDLSALFKLSVEQSRALLARPGLLIKKGVDLQTAVKYQAALEKRGCACVVEPDVIGQEDLTIDSSAMHPEHPADQQSAPTRRAQIVESSLSAKYGPEKAYYATRFESFDVAGGAFKPTWNWFSLLFGPLWYLYKGLWAKGALMIVITFALAGVPAVFFWLYAAIAGNYDYYLLRRRGTQLWSTSEQLTQVTHPHHRGTGAKDRSSDAPMSNRTGALSRFGRLAFLAAIAVGGVFAILIGKDLIEERRSQQDMSYAISAPSTLNALERAVLVGRSTKQQFAEFRNQGGLDNESSWRGFRVLTVETVYEPTSGTLGMLQLTLMKSAHRMRLASFNEISQSLVPECGSRWTQNDAQQIAGSHMAENGRTTCAVQESPDGQVAVHILTRRVPTESSNSTGVPASANNPATTRANTVASQLSPSAGIPTAEEAAAESRANDVDASSNTQSSGGPTREDEECARARTQCYEKQSGSLRAACISALQAVRQCGS